MSTNREVVSGLRGMIETETQEGEERKFLEKKKNGMAAGGVGAGTGGGGEGLPRRVPTMVWT